MMISQFKTEGVLRDHVAKHGVHVETSTEPTAIEQDADGVNVTLKKVDNARRRQAKEYQSKKKQTRKLDKD